MKLSIAYGINIHWQIDVNNMLKIMLFTFITNNILINTYVNNNHDNNNKVVVFKIVVVTLVMYITLLM